MKKFTLPLLMLIVSVFPVFAQKKTPSQRADSLIKIMTLEEKVGQMVQYSGRNQPTGPLLNDTNIEGEIKKGRVGSMLNIRGVERVKEVQEWAMQSRLKIPLLFGLDVIHGYQTISPIPLAEAASWDLEEIERSARLAAKEAAAGGIHWTFAPMVDVSRDPRWGRIMESSGEDTYLNSVMGVARIKGFQGKGLGNTDAIMACVKHYAAYGAAMAGRDYNTVDINDRTLWEVYMPPFKAAVDAGAATLMNAYHEIAGIPCTGNTYLVQDVLKKQWNFKGFVVSDWGSIGEMVVHGYTKDRKEAAKVAIEAGCDMDMQSKCYIDYLVELVGEKKVDEKVIDEAVNRILTKKFEMGLFENPFRFLDEKREKSVMSDPQRKTLVRNMAKKSIVLLKNEKNVLPISKQTKTIALIGPHVNSRRDMDGDWAGKFPDTTEIVTVYEGLQNKLGKSAKLLYSKGCSIKGGSKDGFADAVATAQKADVVVMAMGEYYDMTGESHSRVDINLPGVQEELIKEIVKTGKPVVVLMMSGRPMTFKWTAENAPAILYTWFLGCESGNAIADVLFGDYNPSAKLPVTIPRAVGQVPIFYASRSTGRPVLDEKEIEDHSAYVDEKNTPQYAFGHGLSYSNFEYSNLKISKDKFKANEKITVSFNIRNNSKFDGEEIAQLYIHDIAATVTRPVKELKDFKKVLIKAGATQSVTFTIDSEKLSFYNQQLQFVVEPGDFEVMIGAASDNIKLQGKVEVVE